MHNLLLASQLISKSEIRATCMVYFTKGSKVTSFANCHGKDISQIYFVQQLEYKGALSRQSAKAPAVLSCFIDL
jgi:hypothetical protein